MTWKTKKILLGRYLGTYNTSDKRIILWPLIRQTNRFFRIDKELLDKYALALQIFLILVISTQLRYLLLYKTVKCTNSSLSKQLEVLKRNNVAFFKYVIAENSELGISLSVFQYIGCRMFLGSYAYLNITLENLYKNLLRLQKAIASSSKLHFTKLKTYDTRLINWHVLHWISQKKLFIHRS